MANAGATMMKIANCCLACIHPYTTIGGHQLDIYSYCIFCDPPYHRLIGVM